MLHPEPSPAADQLVGTATKNGRAAARPSFSCMRHDAPDGTIRLAVSGELDLATAPELDRALRGAHHASLVIVDLRELAFIDCSGLRVLLAAAARARASGARFLVLRGRPHIDRLLTLTHTEHRFETVAECGA